MRSKLRKGKSGQEIQDEIFKRMSADEKLMLGSTLWQLARDLVGNKIHYGKDRSNVSPIDDCP